MSKVDIDTIKFGVIGEWELTPISDYFDTAEEAQAWITNEGPAWIAENVDPGHVLKVQDYRRCFMCEMAFGAPDNHPIHWERCDDGCDHGWVPDVD
jgi:hypothetical protein